jgi:hypothetical protein
MKKQKPKKKPKRKRNLGTRAFQRLQKEFIEVVFGKSK